MSQSKHTPAPWKVMISGRFTPDHKVQPTYVLNYVGRTIPAISEDEAAANGRLIEAAPDLLVALKDAIMWIDIDDQGAPEMIAKWLAVIAKAEGNR